MSSSNRFQKPILIGIAIFCLVVFSVTGAMTLFVDDTIGGGGDSIVARMQLPSGPVEINQLEYARDRGLLSLGQRLQLLPAVRNPDTQDILIFGLHRRLADELEIAVPDAHLAQLLMQMPPVMQGDYGLFVRQLGYPSKVSFETDVREIFKVRQLQLFLQAAAVPTTEDVLAWWSERYAEIKVEYAVWAAEDFVEAAEAEEVDDEKLQEYFDNDLTGIQKNELERDEGVAFEALVLSADALATEAVKDWIDEEEPTESQLEGWHRRHQQRLYRRAEEDIDPDDPNQTSYYTMEELGDRLSLDFRMYAAVESLLEEVADVEDLNAFAAEKGIELVVYDEPVAITELADLPRIGMSDLAGMRVAEIGQWSPTPYIQEGLSFITRPSEVTEREMPPFEEVRDEVLEFWREKRQLELAQEASEAFIDGLEKSEEWEEGDPIEIDEATFAAAVSDSGRELQLLDWISRLTRLTTDPLYDKEKPLPAWLRTRVGMGLDDMIDGQIVGPFEHSQQKAILVGRLAGRRDADLAKIWPGELDQARRAASFDFRQKFDAEHLSYEGLARAYQIENLWEVSGNESTQ